MRQSVTRDLYAYWSRVKGARSAPERSEIDPAQIHDALADSFMIEIDALGSYPIRLCGARVNALWLAEQKGRSFLELWDERDRGRLAEVLSLVIGAAAPVAARAEGRAVSGQDAAEDEEKAELELVLLPLRHFGRAGSRVLGAFAPVRRPSWLGFAAVGPLALRSVRVLQEEAMQDGAMQDGATRDGAARDGAANESSLRPPFVDDRLPPSAVAARAVAFAAPSGRKM